MVSIVLPLRPLLTACVAVVAAGGVVAASAGGDGPGVFSSVEAGIEVPLPPGGSAATNDPEVLAAVVKAPVTLGADEDAEVVQVGGYRFELRRRVTSVPRKLAGEELAEGGRRAGLLEVLADEVQSQTPGEVLRREILPLANADAGIYVHRFGVGSADYLRQMAVVPLDDTVYYQLVMLSPVPSGLGDGDARLLGADPHVREAVRAFMRSVDGVRLLDQSGLLEDQQERLVRTRSLMVNVTRGKLASVLNPSGQWVRVRQDGQDEGYAYFVEEPADRLPGLESAADDADGAGDAREVRGFRVGQRWRLFTDDGQLDRETWSFSTFDRSEEDFRERNTLSEDGRPITYGLVAGQSRQFQRMRRITGRDEDTNDAAGRVGGIARAAEPTVLVTDQRRLDVQYVVENTPRGEPLVRNLPAWYVPQAVDHLMPRLVAPLGRRTYLVATFVPDRQEVWQRYMDVEGIRRVEVRGPNGTERRDAVVVRSRLGMTGSETVHYIDPDDYRWLGTVNEGSRTELWPSSPRELASIWPNQEFDVPPEQIPVRPGEPGPGGRRVDGPERLVPEEAGK